ncbi:uncharacterized protein LOC122484474 isoform X2 [Prionailurus bengalensis]|uniref:uncharacterized protein LOC122484474 isoform X2 n=1 Tax=Prionailurus bengalensis TaxID=37029 RepID=UPI001CA814AD|nr:uncharacterized protein LOC122484474 isoform X2 [Prionailurus bengalensis]
MHSTEATARKRIETPRQTEATFSDQRTRLPSWARPSPWAPGSSPVRISPSHQLLLAPGWGGGWLEPACGGAEDKASIQIADGNRETLCPPHGPHLFPSGVWRSSWALDLGLPGLILPRKGSSERCPTLEFFKGVGEKHRGALFPPPGTSRQRPTPGSRPLLVVHLAGKGQDGTTLNWDSGTRSAERSCLRKRSWGTGKRSRNGTPRDCTGLAETHVRMWESGRVFHSTRKKPGLAAWPHSLLSVSDSGPGASKAPRFRRASSSSRSWANSAFAMVTLVPQKEVCYQEASRLSGTPRLALKGCGREAGSRGKGRASVMRYPSPRGRTERSAFPRQGRRKVSG